MYIVAYKGLLDAINNYTDGKAFEGLLLYHINTRVRRNLTRLYGADYETYLDEPATRKMLSDIESFTEQSEPESAPVEVLEETNYKLESDLIRSTVTNNKSIDKEENDKSKNKNRMSLFDINKKATNKKNIRGGNKRGSCFFNQNIKMDKKTINNFINAPDQKKTITLKDESESYIDSDDLDNLLDILEQNDEEKFYSKCKNINILEEAFNNKFYDIIDYELDNIKKFIENIKMDSPVKIEYIRNYIENGVLIPTIFYFKKIFNLKIKNVKTRRESRYRRRSHQASFYFTKKSRSRSIWRRI
jgi:hypothetical protein